MRKCGKCGTEKPLSEYYLNHGRYVFNCKPCYNASRNVRRRAQRAEAGRARTRITSPEELAKRKAEYARRREAERLKAGKFVGDGPCWCCRNQAAGTTPYRLCIICLG